MPRPENDLAIEQRVREPRRVPALSLVLGYAAMAPAGVLGASLLGPKWGGVATHLVVVWGGAILTFLAGVRRGLSFRTVPLLVMRLWSRD